MNSSARQSHWQTVFKEKDTQQVSWYEESPDYSLEWIKNLNLPLDARILDVGAGDSRLPDALVKVGYSTIHALDISELALLKSKNRLGPEAKNVDWIVSDILDYQSDSPIDLWYDRAVFHFIREAQDISKYIENAYTSLGENGLLLIGTFSDQGPMKCSGLEVKRYSEAEMTATFSPRFCLIKTERYYHQTPAGGKQEFLFCLFRKLP